MPVPPSLVAPISPDLIHSINMATKAQDSSINIVMAHANGFPKELYEPFIEALFRELPIIQAVFIHDVIGQGASGVLNAPLLGDEYCWSDSSLDLLFMIHHLRRTNLMDDSPLVGLGHSMGGCQLAYASLLHHRLFCGLILIEPIIFDHSLLLGMSNDVTSASMRRRDKWPSKSEARTRFLKSPFYQSWDPVVFEKWMEFGIRPTGHGEEVTLTTTVAQEVYSFTHYLPQADTVDTDPDASTYVARHLSYLAQPIHFMFGADSATLPPPYREMLVSTAAGSTRTDVQDSGHLFPMEKPEYTASLVSGLVAGIHDRWKREEAQDAKATRRSDLTDEFKQRVFNMGKRASKV